MHDEIRKLTLRLTLDEEQVQRSTSLTKGEAIEGYQGETGRRYSGQRAAEVVKVRFAVPKCRERWKATENDWRQTHEHGEITAYSRPIATGYYFRDGGRASEASFQSAGPGYSMRTSDAAIASCDGHAGSCFTSVITYN